MSSNQDLPLRELFVEFYAPLQLVGCSEKTTLQYGIQLKHFAEFLGHSPTLADLSDDRLTAFLAAFSVGRSPATANKCRSHILALWRFAAKRGLVEVWPTVKSLREPLRAPQAWSVEQLRALMAACEKVPGWIGPVRASAWWVSLHRVLWDTGERISAVLDLTWRDVDLERGWVTFRAETRKFRRADVVHRLKPATVRALEAMREPRRDEVFYWPLGRYYLWRRYDRILARAGLPNGRRDKFHRMRRSVASHAEANGGDATRILGHSTRRVTEAYLDPRIVGRPQAADVLPDLDEPPAA